MREIFSIVQHRAEVLDAGVCAGNRRWSCFAGQGDGGGGSTGRGGHINRGPKTEPELTDTEAELTETDKIVSKFGRQFSETEITSVDSV
jgi:hypothetical protein